MIMSRFTIYTVSQKKGYHPTTNHNFINNCPIPVIFMVALWNRADHYIFALWLLLLSFFLSSFFSSPNLSRRRLDVWTHGVALVRISDAGLKSATRGLLKTQDAKKLPKSPSGHHRTTLSAISLQLRHVSTIGKKTC